MKYLRLFEGNRDTDTPSEYFSSHDQITCPYCKEIQTNYRPWEIVKWGIGYCDCSECGRKFQVEKEEIYHSSKIEVDRSDRER